MAKAGYCKECGTNVWLKDDGSCEQGHPASGVSDVYEASLGNKSGVSKSVAPIISFRSLNIFFGIGIFLFGWLILIAFYGLGKRGLGWLYYSLILILIISGNQYYKNIPYMIGSVFASGAISAAFTVNPPFVLGYLAIAIHVIAWIHANKILSAELVAEQKNRY